LEAGVAYGYFPCVSEGDDLVVLESPDDPDGPERCRFTFPRQRRDRHLCLADFFRPRASGEVDVVAFTVVTMGARVSEATAELFALLAPGRIGVELCEEFQLVPEQSTSAIIAHHPEAKYFNAR